MADRETICLQSTAFYALLDEVLEHIENKFQLTKDQQWIDTTAAMSVLGIRSRTTLQSLRDAGKIRFSQNTKKGILYDRTSLIAYIEGGAQNIF